MKKRIDLISKLINSGEYIKMKTCFPHRNTDEIKSQTNKFIRWKKNVNFIAKNSSQFKCKTGDMKKKTQSNTFKNKNLIEKCKTSIRNNVSLNSLTFDSLKIQVHKWTKLKWIKFGIE